jgi:Uma2 family endonuclease
MVDGEYQVNQFKGDERIISSVFKELTLTANQIFRAGD